MAENARWNGVGTCATLTGREFPNMPLSFGISHTFLQAQHEFLIPTFALGGRHDGRKCSCHRNLCVSSASRRKHRRDMLALLRQCSYSKHIVRTRLTRGPASL